MIKVFMSGVPIYKLCFNRRKYSVIKRKPPGLAKIAAVIERRYNGGDAGDIIDAVSKLFLGKPLYETTAIVYLADAKKGEPPVAKATVRQNPTDTHSPEGGRIAALKKLLNRDPALFGGHISSFGKGEREAIYQAYANRPRGVAAPPAPEGAPTQAVVPAPAPARKVSAISSRPQGKAQAKTAPPHGVVNKVVGFFATNKRTH